MIAAIHRARSLYTDQEIYLLTEIPPRTLQDWANERRSPPPWARLFITETMLHLCERKRRPRQ